MKKKVILLEAGFMPYDACWAWQEPLFPGKVQFKIKHRVSGEELEQHPENHWIFVEHNPVITLGKSGKTHHLLASPEWLKQRGIDFFPINRGGDITYHGPGQLVAYPIIDLEQFFTDIHRFLRLLEEAVIQTIAEWNIVGERLPGATGVWMDAGIPGKERKICAFGIRCSRWVTMHGLALNINTDLSHFQWIVPCGLEGKGVTSMAQELNHPVDMGEVKQRLQWHLSELFGFEWVYTKTSVITPSS